jgi:DNA-binding GntR family transcriptional regulator
MDRTVKHRSSPRPRRPREDAAPGAEPVSKAGARTVRLAREIAALAARSGWSRGQHLTEQELAKALSVSRTPIRAALTLLASRGAVKAEPNRGFFLMRDGANLAPLLPGQPSTADDVLQTQIIRDRVSGALPIQVSPADLAQRYGARRATMDRVLGRLAAAGLLTREVGQKWQFLPSLDGPSGVRSSYQLRTLVEPAALLMDDAPVPQGPVEEQRRSHLDFLERVGDPARNRAWPPSAVFELDAAFHETVAGFSGNAFVIGLVRQQNALRRLLEFDSYADMRRVSAWVHEHLGILDALAVNDRPLASERLRGHLTRAGAVASDKFVLVPS